MSNNNVIYKETTYTHSRSFERVDEPEPIATLPVSYSGFSAGPQSFSGTSNASSNAAVNQIAADLYQLHSGNSNSRLSAGGAYGTNQFYGASSQTNSGSYGRRLSSSGVSALGHLSVSGAEARLSAVEQAILRSNIPIELNENEEINVNFKGRQERGIWANKSEVVNWRGEIPIGEYLINEDMNPEIIVKRTEQNLVYIQELAIRYLRPPTPPAPGEIVITQEINTLVPPAPPLIIRQQPGRPETPEPLVIREAPPRAPVAVGRKVITISGKRIPPAPRKVVIERLAPLPSKPQNVLVERWLPYSQVKRRVIYQKANQQDAVVVRPRNVIVQWEAPQVQIKKEFKYLGVIRANPAEYVQRYGSSLKVTRQLPQFVLDIKTPEGLVLAADYQYKSLYELEGDVKALSLVDLDREGLSEYRSYLANLGITYTGVSSSSASYGSSGAGFGASNSGYEASSATYSSSASHGASRGQSEDDVVTTIFNSIDRDRNGEIEVDEAARVLLRLNSRLGRTYGEDESRNFFKKLDIDHNGKLSLDEFRRAFEHLI